MTEVEFASQSDALDFYDGKTPIRTFTGVVVREDGKPIILGGVYRDKGAFIAFSQFKVDPKKYKREVLRATQLVVRHVLPRYALVWAIINEDSASEDPRPYIKHFGFKPHGGRDDVFFWRRNLDSND